MSTDFDRLYSGAFTKESCAFGALVSVVYVAVLYFLVWFAGSPATPLPQMSVGFADGCQKEVGDCSISGPLSSVGIGVACWGWHGEVACHEGTCDCGPAQCGSPDGYCQDAELWEHGFLTRAAKFFNGNFTLAFNSSTSALELRDSDDSHALEDRLYIYELPASVATSPLLIGPARYLQWALSRPGKWEDQQLIKPLFPRVANVTDVSTFIPPYAEDEYRPGSLPVDRTGPGRTRRDMPFSNSGVHIVPQRDGKVAIFSAMGDFQGYCLEVVAGNSLAWRRPLGKCIDRQHTFWGATRVENLWLTDPAKAAKTCECGGLWEVDPLPAAEVLTAKAPWSLPKPSHPSAGLTCKEKQKLGPDTMMMLGPASVLLGTQRIMRLCLPNLDQKHDPGGDFVTASFRWMMDLARVCGALLVFLIGCLLCVISVPLFFVLLVPMQKLELYHIERGIAVCVRGVPITYAGFPMFACLALSDLWKIVRCRPMDLGFLYKLGQVKDAVTDVLALSQMIGIYEPWVIAIYAATVAYSVTSAWLGLTRDDMQTLMTWGLALEDVPQTLILLWAFRCEEATEFMAYSFVSSVLGCISKAQTVYLLPAATVQHSEMEAKGLLLQPEFHHDALAMPGSPLVFPPL